MAQRLKTGLALFGLSILAVVAAELLARAVLFVDDTFFDPNSTQGSFDLRARLPAFDDADFDVMQLFEELRSEELTDEKQPYNVWRQRPFDGKYININQRFDRVTAYNSSREDSLQVWVLGGSTAWGFGAPDHQTIQSHLSRLLNMWGLDTRVRNLGQFGYVSTQEVVYLMRELQAGRRPDVVIFYDGVNDSGMAVAFPDIPGAHFKGVAGGVTVEDPGGGKGTAVSLARSTGLYRVSQFVLKRFGVVEDPFGAESRVVEAFSNTQLHQFASQAADIWLANYDLVAALGESYGFVTIFLFQPFLGGGQKSLDLSEQEILTVQKDLPPVRHEVPVMIEFQRLIRRHQEGDRASKNIFDISDAFAGVADPLYIDMWHVTGKANAIVSERIFDILTDELCDNPPPHLSDLTRIELTLVCG